MSASSSKVKNTSKKAKVGVNAAPLDKGFEQCHWFFNDEIDPDTVSKLNKEYVRSNYSEQDAKAILANPEYHFSIHNGRAAAAFWLSKGMEIDDHRYAHYPEYLKDVYDSLIQSGTKILESRKSKEQGPEKKALTPLELLAIKVNSTVLTDLDEMEDEWICGEKSSRDIYQLFKIHDVKGQGAVNQVLEYITNRVDELREAKEKKCEQVVEAFAHVPQKELDRRISVFESMLADLEKLRSAAKATRKPRKRKTQTADKQVKDLKYLKEDNEYRLVSISPEQVPGSIRLYTFNVKTRVLTEYVTLAKSGFAVKGTTIQNHDPESSRSVKLRKPNDFLSTVLSKTPRQIDKEWGTLTTKTIEGVNGRINSDSILLRVLDK